MANKSGLPGGTDLESRLEWSGERMWDLAEDSLSRLDAGIVLATIVGWTDGCPQNERAAYNEAARLFWELMQSKFEIE